MKAYPKAFLQMTFILNHKKMTGTFCWAQPSHSCWDCSDKKKCWHLYWDKSRSSAQEAGLMTIPRRAAALCAHWRPALSLTSGFCVCVSGISWVMVSLSSLIEFEGTYELLHKMDFASSCLQHTHRRNASRFINGNSRQTTEAKDTSVCKRFQMEASFSLHSAQFSF